ncbi:hypothetical protein MRX96_006724 [Rhipicephalus microplus]
MFGRPRKIENESPLASLLFRFLLALVDQCFLLISVSTVPHPSLCNDATVTPVVKRKQISAQIRVGRNLSPEGGASPRALELFQASTNGIQAGQVPSIFFILLFCCRAFFRWHTNGATAPTSECQGQRLSIETDGPILRREMRTPLVLLLRASLFVSPSVEHILAATRFVSPRVVSEAWLFVVASHPPFLCGVSPRPARILH